MELKVYLDKPKAEESVLMIYVSVNGFYIRVSAGLKINPKNCVLEGASRVAKIKASFANAREYNLEIDRLLNFIRNYIISKNNTGQLTKGQLKKAIENFKSPFLVDTDITTLQLFKEYLNYKQGNGNYINGRRLIKESSMQIYFCRATKLKEFITKEKTFQSITEFNSQACMSRFIKYCIDLDNNYTTINAQVSTIKSFLTWCMENEYIHSVSWKGKNLKSEQQEFFALNEAELELFTNVDLPPHLEKTRWLFLVQCYTGVRFSDLMRIQTQDVDYENRVIILNTKKTDTIIKIPIMDKLAEILYLHNIKDLQNANMISAFNIRNRIRRIAELAGISDKITHIRYVKGEKKVELVPKYQIISTHTARRTFITEALRKGVPDRLIMKVTGHSSMKSFERYVKFTHADVESAFRKAFEQ